MRTVVLLMVMLLTIAPAIGAIETAQGTFVVDIGFGYGPKFPAMFPVAVSMGYFVADGVEVEAWFNGALVLLFLLWQPSEPAGSSSESSGFRVPIGVDVNWYPGFLGQDAYLCLGLSNTEATLLAITGGIGINSQASEPDSESDIVYVRHFYAEAGVSYLPHLKAFDPAMFEEYPCALRPDYTRLVLAHAEAGLRSAGASE